MIPKFRVWDKNNKKMLGWKELDFTKERDEDEITIFEPTGQFAHPIFFYDAMQSTGLKDISGTVIYEGDIVHVNYKLSIVKYAKGSFYIEFIDFPKIIMLSDFYFKSYTNDLILKVLGNIYENPELLEDN